MENQGSVLSGFPTSPTSALLNVVSMTCISVSNLGLGKAAHA
jgi:hypothetical protein